MNRIDWNRFNWKKIFGVVSSTDKMKRPQARFQRAEIIEVAIDKYSGGQLKYVGDTADGMDFEGSDGLRYECKGQGKIWQESGRVPHTTSLTLKNHRTDKKEKMKKTFDYMILVDTGKNRVGVCKWKDCDITNNDADITFRVIQDKITVVADNVTPDAVLASKDLDKDIQLLIRESI